MRCLFLLSMIVPVACSAAALTGQGFVTYNCWDESYGLVAKKLSATDSTGSLTAVCSTDAPPRDYASLSYSATYNSLSMSASSSLFPWGGSASGYAAFSDSIAVTVGTGAAFLLLSGESDTTGGSDQISSLVWNLDLGSGHIGTDYISEHGVLSQKDRTDSGAHTFVDTFAGYAGRTTSISRTFSYWIPIAFDTPVAIRGQMSLKAGGTTTQSIQSNLRFALSVVDSDLNPVAYSITSDSGSQYSTPEPDSVLLAALSLPVILIRALRLRVKRHKRGNVSMHISGETEAGS